MAKVKKKLPKLIPSLGYLDGRYLAYAVLRVFRENEKTANISGFDANADTWASNSTMRQDIFDRARKVWCQTMQEDFTWFPYSEDAVARLYLRLRKRNADEITAWEKELKDALGIT